jgi:hypothetical protein
VALTMIRPIVVPRSDMFFSLFYLSNALNAPDFFISMGLFYSRSIGDAD